MRFVEQYQYQALFLLLLVEESGIPLPVPGDGMMMFAGYRASIGRLGIVPAFAAIEAGTLIGATILWCLGRWGGRPIIHRYGRYLHITEQRLDLAERWFVRHGRLSIVLGRLVPGLRIATSFICGVLGVPFLVYLPYVAIGSSLYVLFFMGLGLGFGRYTRTIARLFWPHPLMLGVALVLFVGVVGGVLLYRRRVRLVPS